MLALLIPLYNHAAYIGPAIRSVLDQTRPPDHIIIVDDGSTDGSPDLVQRDFGHLPHLQLHRQPNAGAHATLNRAVTLAHHARCDLVAILNSDDLHHPARLATCQDHLAANPATHLLCTSLDLIGSEGQPLPTDAPYTRWFHTLQSWENIRPPVPPAAWLGLGNFPLTTSNFVARTPFLLQHPFRPYRYVHDYATLLHAALRDHLAILPQRLLSYRIHSANTISAPQHQIQAETLLLYLDLLADLAPELDTSPALQRNLALHLANTSDNLSSLRPDLLAHLLARLLATTPSEQRHALAQEVTRPDRPEMQSTPNHLLANHPPPPGQPLQPHRALAHLLATNYDTLTTQHTQLALLREKIDDWTTYANALETALASPLLALLTLLGHTRRRIRPTLAELKTPRRKLERLQKHLRQETK